MRCHYMSDLHLESECIGSRLPEGDILIVAGDLCHAGCLDPSRSETYAVAQRDRVMRFVDGARTNFTHVLLIAGNHEYYDGVFEETVDLLRRNLPGVTVLDDETIEIDGVRFFGSTLWSDFEGRSDACLNGVRRRMGEYFFVKTRKGAAPDAVKLPKFQPEDALAAHDAAWAALRREVASGSSRPTVVISHHAPSRLGCHPQFMGNGLDGAYYSNLDADIALFDNVPVWIHGHTHVARTYRIGATTVRSNARGFVAKGQGARGFTVNAGFEI